ncbi:MAG TPA: 2Fe-2S iron-sulfur cluster-binding protein, partial [Dermatophilaceae bacterium]|nr:2Fe-2S iron-sulfur cluster-binding protein [Dermatophilaceae bacterium]
MAELSVTVNGMPLPLDGVAPSVSLLDALRAQGLTGAKEGCAEGECGACSVLVARPAADGGSQWVAVNACLPPALSYAGQEIVTAEGLGSPGDLHPVQAELAHRGGSQCGYCTPGFVCSMAAEYYRPDRAGLEQRGREVSTSESAATERNSRKVREGLVVSDKMDKTVVVSVED